MPPASQNQSLDAQLFRDLFSASPIGIAVENLDGQPVFVNPALCSMLGFSEEEMRSKHCVQFSPPEDAEKDWNFFRQLRAGLIDHYHLDKRYYRRDGSLIWGRLSISLLNSTPPLVVAMVEDITERKLAERELAQSNERLHLTLEVGRIGGWEWDLQTGQTFWFGQNYALLGARPEKDSASEETFWKRVHPEDREWLRESLQKALQDRLQSAVAEFRVVWPDQTVHWLRSEARYFYGEDGQPERMLGISTDITERKIVEEGLRKSEERFRLAAQAGKVFAYEWDVATDIVVRSGDIGGVLGPSSDAQLTRQQVLANVHPDDRARFAASANERTPESPNAQITYRTFGADGSVDMVGENRPGIL